MEAECASLIIHDGEPRVGEELLRSKARGETGRLAGYTGMIPSVVVSLFLFLFL